MNVRSISGLAIVLALAVAAGPAAADNKQRVNPTFAGKIMLSDKRFPMSARSLAAFNAQIQKQSRTSFAEDKDKKWTIHFAGFLKTPLNDVEYLIKVYELNGKAQQLLLTFEQFTDERGQTALISKMVLERKQIGVNKQLLITMENRGKVLASSRFKVLGLSDKHSGKVDFTEDEANGATTEDDE